MRRLVTLVPIFTALVFSTGSAPVPPSDHCLSRISVTPLAGGEGVMLKTPNGERSTLFAPQARFQEGASLVRIFARDTTFDADGIPTTIRDTITVAVGTDVRWEWVTGFHTITDGVESGPKMGQLFDYVLDQAHPVFDTTLSTIGKLDYFCQAHETIMHGVIHVVGPASVGAPVSGPRLLFSRAPAPNPTRGTVGFAITLSRSERVTIEVHDATGRRIARLHDGVLDVGEHPFTWSGRATNGRSAAGGVYAVTVRAGNVRETRRFSLLR